MSEPHKSTDQIRMIAVGAMRQQAEVCEVKRESLEDKMIALTETVRANAASITALTNTVTTLVATVFPLPESVQTNTSDIATLKGRPAIWAAIGAAVPVILGVAALWFKK